MKTEEQVRTAGNSSRGIGMGGRTLYPVVTRPPTSAATAIGQPSWSETNTAGSDALISVWWEYYPSI
jgi:hypothetical protein